MELRPEDFGGDSVVRHGGPSLREVWAEVAAGSIHGVACGAPGLGGEENGFTFVEVSTRGGIDELGNRFLREWKTVDGMAREIIDGLVESGIAERRVQPGVPDGFTLSG